MMKGLFILGLVVLLSSLSFAQNYNGNVKSVVTFEYEVLGKPSDNIDRKCLKNKEVIEIDTAGRIIAEINYNPNGEKYKEHIFIFDSVGNNIVQTIFHSVGKIDEFWKRVQKFNNDKMVVNCSVYDKSDNIIWIEIFKYDDKGKEVERVALNPDGSAREKILSLLDSADNITSQEYYSEGKLTTTTTNKYDNSGNCIETIEQNANGQVIKKDINVYTSNRLTTINHYSFNSSPIGTTKYEFNDKGLKVSEILYDPVNNIGKKVLFKYGSNDELITTNTFSKGEVLQNSEFRKYDDNNNCISEELVIYKPGTDKILKVKLRKRDFEYYK